MTTETEKPEYAWNRIFFEEPAHLPKDAARLAPDALTAPEIERLL